MRRTFTLLLLMASLVVSGCGDDKGGDGSGDGEASKPKVEVPDGPPPLELEIKDLKVGTGAEAVAGKIKPNETLVFVVDLLEVA